ncbi:cytochrome P450 [Amycolatopsis sp. NPDC049868]|uniref:cytochrome P450 n=1 Tax=Amycolatopsis sp. NPDC049868 TaxID=3363934 RepID=UPI0037B62659
MKAKNMTNSLDAMMRLMEPENRKNPFPFLAWLRANAPVHRTPRGTYLLSRHSDVARVLRETGTVFRSPDREQVRRRNPEALRHPSMMLFADSIAVSNPPAHTRLRDAIGREFTAQRVADRRLRITNTCDRLIDRITEPLRDGEEVDLHRDLAEPLAMGTQSDLIGIPEADRAWMASLVEGVLSAFPGAPAEVVTQADELTAVLEDYFSELIEHRRREPADDLISALTGRHSRLEPRELFPLLWALWCAGFKTSSAGISSSLLALLDHPDQHHWIQDRVAAFTNEALRHSPPTIMAPFVRIATRDVEFEGGTVTEGADVRLLIGAANRDPSVFPAPDLFDPSRDTTASLAFGDGIHACVGAALARLEIETTLPRLQARFPGLVKAAEPTWSPGVFHYLTRTLPVVLP